MKYTQSFIEEVLFCTSIVEIISRHTQLNLKSGQYFGICPYPDHEEKTASFSVSEEKQVYYCFGCHKSGNVVTFLRDIQGMSFLEAINYLSLKGGLSLQKGNLKKHLVRKQAILDPSKGSSNGNQLSPLAETSDFLKLKPYHSSFFDKKRAPYKVQEMAMNFWHQMLLKKKDHSKLNHFLKKRGLNLETIKKFKIGWAKANGNQFIQFLKSEKVSLELARQIGLLRKNKSTQMYYDGFRDRLMFPIFSTQSQCIGFGGRSLDENTLPKYLNSPESAIFHKAEVLYGLDQSARYIRDRDRVFVVEGYMDFISLFQKGVKNVVSTLGTALSLAQAKKLRFFTKNVVLFFDGDQAGRKASLRSLLNLLSSGLLPRIFELQEGTDPDEWIHQNGSLAFEVEAKRTPELFEVFLEEELKGFQNKASEKIQILDKIVPLLQSIPDFRLKNLYIDEVSKRLELKKEVIYKSVSLNAKNKPKGKSLNQNLNFLNQKKEKLKDGDENEKEMKKRIQKLENHFKEDDRDNESFLEIKLPIPKAEHFLLHLALKNEKTFLKLLIEKQHEVISCFTHEGIKKIFYLSEKIYRQNSKIFDRLIALLMMKVKPNQILHPPLFIEEMKLESINQFVSDCLFQIQDLHIRKKCDELSKKIELTSSEHETSCLLKEFMNERIKRQKLQKMRL